MAVIIDHRRIPMLDDIVRQFEVELDAQLGFVEAEISSARPLSAEQKRELESRVERMTGKKVRARYASNPQLLGGVMVRVGSTIYDGSVRGQLEKMKEQLSVAIKRNKSYGADQSRRDHKAHTRADRQLRNQDRGRRSRHGHVHRRRYCPRLRPRQGAWPANCSPSRTTSPASP